MTKPKEDKKWTLKEGGKETRDEIEIPEIFNQFFVQKIENLKDNIATAQIKYPKEELHEKISAKKLHFTLRTVTKKE